MAIETRNTLIVGRCYSFRIRQGDQQVDVEGRVMWCVLVRSERHGQDREPVFRAGIQFEFPAIRGPDPPQPSATPVRTGLVTAV